jgi:hypothetical protein
MMRKSRAILLSGIGGVTGCFDWAEINYGWRVGRQVTRWLILTVGCDRAVVEVGSPDCACRCFPGLVGCIIINDDAYWLGFVD